MSFLAPWAFFFGAIAPVIVLLYLLKSRRRAETVSTLLFWQRVLEEKRRTALFHRLRNPLSLLLHLLIFGLLLLALARPVLDSAVPSGASTVVILDTRARMQARHGERQRFGDARQAALALLAQAGPQREIAVITAGAETRVVAPFSADPRLLREAVEVLTPTDAGGELNAAIRLASNLLTSRPGTGRIVLLTSPTGEPLPQNAPTGSLEVRTFGIPSENTAITQFSARQLPADPRSTEVFLEISHFGHSTRAGSVELRLGDATLDVRPYEIAPGQRVTFFFPVVLDAAVPSDGLLTAKLNGHDALSVDNTAFAILPLPEPRRVLLVTEGNWFLEKLIAADQRVRFELLKPEVFRGGMEAQFDAVIFDRFLPPGMTVGTLSANALFIGDSPLPKSASVDQPTITETSETHPFMRGVNLRNVTISKAMPPLAEPTGGWRFQTLLTSFENALLVVGEQKAKRLAVIGFDLLDSDLPLRVAFPMLISNAVQWLAGGSEGPMSSRQAGEGGTLLSGPYNDDKGPVAAATWQPSRNGFYREARESPVNWVAVNTFNRAESDLSGETPRSTEVKDRRGLSLASLLTIPPWTYLAGAAALLLLLEWKLFHRRRTE